MSLLNIGCQRMTYRVELAYSPLFEAALGIAAATYDQIHPTLEHPPSYWKQLQSELPLEVEKELMYAKQHNTWKTLLHLLHQRSFPDLESFLSYLKKLSPFDLRYYSLPYLGEECQDARRQAAEGSEEAMIQLQTSCRDHLFFPAYIAHIYTTEPDDLRRHLLCLMEGWFLTHIKPHEETIVRTLERDCSQKQVMQTKLSAEALVEWATNGSYPPEPTVTRVLLIPHAIYRPWTIQADAEGTKIFYYPVDDEHLHRDADPYRPPLPLVQALKALGDEQRLRLVKMLSEQDLSLQEMTETLGGAKSTVHHHLSMLRSAHLVETVNGKYRLKRTVLDKLPLHWEQFLGGSLDARH
ncbi:metalloregulator ArsR/SmtB family transcription factor [Brevibacillus choshinensis]|uniref:ArsR/SmtB family transcription factor n=1 Tax=Brevibacillus choshinensis TaxID=54911 RepID=UPI002E22D524|nr:metalloregulator ArsR/SmtB family transcription factor [Brevibacillus choshinensis]MED4754310.1 metalloregulator ArsR/SmtB family transcription factor [Brevibacillus choshinensis]MED4782511.1 metalloregulator ArsR/SmtB family transcription factor [Brevibacillus choshinensis]